MIWLTAALSGCIDDGTFLLAGAGPGGVDITCAQIVSLAAGDCTTLPSDLKSPVQSACPAACQLCGVSTAQPPTAPTIVSPPVPPQNPGCTADGSTGVPTTLLSLFPVTIRGPLECRELIDATSQQGYTFCHLYSAATFQTMVLLLMQNSVPPISGAFTYSGPALNQLCARSCGPFGAGPCGSPSPPPPE